MKEKITWDPASHQGSRFMDWIGLILAKVDQELQELQQVHTEKTTKITSR